MKLFRNIKGINVNFVKVILIKKNYENIKE